MLYSPIKELTNELKRMGFPKIMARRMAEATFEKSGIDSKSPQNNLPAFYIDGNDIILIDTSLGLKS